MYDKYCKTCKTSLNSFYATGMLGCPNCYKAFGLEIELALKKIQGRTFHAGKTPSVSKLDRELISEYESLNDYFNPDNVVLLDFNSIKSNYELLLKDTFEYKDELFKARRIIERIKKLTEDLPLESENKRN